MLDIDLSDLDVKQLLKQVHTASKEQRIAFAGVLAGVCILGFAALDWWPRLRQAEQLEMQIVDSMGKLEVNAKQVKSQFENQRELEILRMVLPELIIAFPKEEQIPALLENVYSALQGDAIDLNLFKPQTSQAQEAYTRVPVKLELNGGAQAVSRIPNILGGLSRRINLTDFTLTWDNERKIWRLAGDLVAFAQPRTDVVAGAADSLASPANGTGTPSKSGASAQGTIVPMRTGG
ncbi:MAG: type 4a pilus biogenesis protein PilO [Limnobacter sp.]|nr:type 4a pilus biogenesis protein PilO [Limnobacter sp.]